ncbi:MAG: nucleotidyltransferase family protein [Thermoplasmatales archaeon]
MEIKGALLTGGYGKRMQGLDPGLPKNLLPIRDNYTILDRQLRDFKIGGIDEVYMLTGYLGDKIEKKFGNNWRGIRLEYFREERPMGTLWSLRNLFSNVPGDFVVRNGDTICDVDLRDFIRRGERSKKIGYILAVKMRSPYGILKIAGNTVREIDEKPLMNHYINAGTYLLKEDITRYLKKRYEGKDIEKTLFRQMSIENNLGVMKYDGFWVSVDSLKDYEKIREEYEGRTDHEFGYSVHRKGWVETYFVRKAEIKAKMRYEIAVLRGSVVKNGRKYGRGSKIAVEKGDDLSFEENAISRARLKFLSDMPSF